MALAIRGWKWQSF